MRLNAKILKNVNNVNSWVYANQAFVSEGQSNIIYLQIVDLDQSTDPSVEKSQAFPQNPIRYISSATDISLEATFPSLDEDSVFTVVGSQPFSQDKSIWKFELSDDQIPSTGTIELKLTEASVVKTFKLKGAIALDSSSFGGC